MCTTMFYTGDIKCLKNYCLFYVYLELLLQESFESGNGKSTWERNKPSPVKAVQLKTLTNRSTNLLPSLAIQLCLHPQIHGVLVLPSADKTTPLSEHQPSFYGKPLPVIHKHNPSKQQAIMQPLQPELMHLTQKHCSQSRSIIAPNCQDDQKGTNFVHASNIRALPE